MIDLKSDKTDEHNNEKLIEDLQESYVYFETEEPGASPINSQRPQRSSRMQRELDRYQPPVALLSAPPAEPSTWYQGVEYIDSRKVSQATDAKYNILLESQT